MGAAMIIARSVVVAQRSTLAAAAVLAVLLGAVMIGWPGNHEMLFALRPPLVAAALLGAFLVGMSLLGEELASGRLAFWFARPISAWSIWGGKLAGALVVAAALQLAILLPTSGSGPTSADNGLHLALWCTALAAAGGMLSGVLARGRSSMAMFNRVGMVVVAALAVRLMLRIDALTSAYHEGAMTAERLSAWRVIDRRMEIIFYLVVAGATLACLAGTAAAVVAGRTSPARAHAAGSIAAWSIAAPVAIAAFVVLVP